MRKILLRAVLVVVVFFGFTLVRSERFGSAQLGTGVSGIISSDTTWTKANSPYNLTGNALIESGVTVTVEPGTIVNLNGYYIRINGTLIIQPGASLNMGSLGTKVGFIEANGVLTARGTGTDPIRFNGAVYSWSGIIPQYSVSYVSFAHTSLPWDEKTGSGCIIENALMDKTSIQTYSSIKISNNILNDAGIGAFDGSPVISNNVVPGEIDVLGGSPVIANNQLRGGRIYVSDRYGLDNPVITSNLISDPKVLYDSHPAGIALSGDFDSDNGLVLIEKNVITDYFCGIQLADNENRDMRKPIMIRSNTILNNEVGISVTDRFSPVLINNNIYNNNASIAMSYFASRDINASYNWWGTTEISEIDRLIYDYSENFNLGRVNYNPILTAPDPSAPDPNSPIPEAIIPSPTPLQTPTPTATATPTPPPTPTMSASSQPTQTPTLSPSQTGTPTPVSSGLSWSEIAIISLLGLIAVLLAILVVSSRKNRRLQANV
ncbi:MAG: right-handed parallel beta-helix repeat-containing protein [Candidatus Bathyarchaeia archaeon]